MKISSVSNFSYRSSLKRTNFGHSATSDADGVEILRKELKFNCNHIKELYERINDMKKNVAVTTDNSFKEILQAHIKTLQNEVDNLTRENSILIEKIKSMNSSGENVSALSHKSYNNDEPKMHGWYGEYTFNELDEYIRDIMNPPCSFL